jgi:WD40 repeat protein
LSQYLTSAGDKKLRIWNANTHKRDYISQELPHEIKAVDWAANGNFIVVGDRTGNIMLFDP